MNETKCGNGVTAVKCVACSTVCAKLKAVSETYYAFCFGQSAKKVTDSLHFCLSEIRFAVVCFAMFSNEFNIARKYLKMIHVFQDTGNRKWR